MAIPQGGIARARDDCRRQTTTPETQTSPDRSLMWVQVTNWLDRRTQNGPGKCPTGGQGRGTPNQRNTCGQNGPVEQFTGEMSLPDSPKNSRAEKPTPVPFRIH